MADNYILSPAPGAAFYLITKLQILRHLSRAQQDAQTDRFDHPLVFARSGCPLEDIDIQEEGQELIENLLAGPYQEDDLRLNHGLGYRSASPVPDEDEVQQAHFVHEGAVPKEEEESATSRVGAAAAYLTELALPISTADNLLAAMETLNGLFTAARVIIALTPNLVNLSLTGIFHRLLCGTTPLPLDELRCLSIGPVLPYWTTLIKSAAAARMKKLERLRICNAKLGKDEIDVIAGVGGVLPRLGQATWECIGDEEPASL